ncbi:MAG TPA: FUSC family protein [Burkholderiales bacterium]|jgi:hypothetical protein|nr:FUSC family protein [Burkholderiales bacterium]
MLKILRKRYFDFSYEVRCLGLRVMILNVIFYLAYLESIDHNLVYIFASGGILVIATLEADAISMNRLANLWHMCLTSLGGGMAIIIGSLLNANFNCIVLFLIFFTIIVGLSRANITIILITELFLSGTSMKFSMEGSFIYGLSFCVASLWFISLNLLREKFTPKNNSAKLLRISFIPLLNITRENLFYAMRLVITTTISYYLVIHWHIPQPNWVPMTVLIVLKFEQKIIGQRVIQRFGGTICGCIIAAFIVLCISNKFILIGLLLPSTYLLICSLPKHYAGYSCFVTVFVALSLDIITNLDLKILEIRAINTGIGVLIVAIMSLLFYLNSRISIKSMT